MTPHTATFADLDTETLYALLKLRVDVFVVEQECPYPELDGRDAEPGTRHVWLDEDGEVVAYLRILLDADGVDRIGRVCTAKTARGGGRAGALMRAALDAIGDRPCVLDAQSYLADWYASFGFTPDGPEFIDDGIPHIPMRRVL